MGQSITGARVNAVEDGDQHTSTPQVWVPERSVS